MTQAGAGYYSLRLSKITGNKIFWNLVAFAFGIMGLINLVTFVYFLAWSFFIPGIDIADIMELVLSALATSCFVVMHRHFLCSKQVNKYNQIEINGLREDVDLYKMILDATSDGIYDFYPQTGHVKFSFRYYTMLGYEDNELEQTYETWESLIHPDDKGRVIKLLQDSVNGNVLNFSIEYRMLTKSVDWLWVQSRGKIVERDEKGRTIRLIGTHMDINDRKKTEQELHATLEKLSESEHKLRLKLDSIFSPDSSREENITLTDLFALEYLQEIQDAFAAANNIATLITDTEGNPITAPSNFAEICQLVRNTKEGNKRCITSNKQLGEKAKKLMKPTYEQCSSCGFALASAPVVVGGHHIANFLIGHSNSMRIQEKDIIRYAHEIDGDVEKMVKAFRIMPDMPLSQFEKVLDLLWIMSEKLSTIAYNNLKLTKELEQRKYVELTLKENE